MRINPLFCGDFYQRLHSILISLLNFSMFWVRFLDKVSSSQCSSSVITDSCVNISNTAEMNPIEQIWKEIRKLGFKNEVFPSLEKVVKRLCVTICSLSKDTIKSITGRDWILSRF